MTLLFLAQTPSPPPGDTTGWPLLVLMAFAALVIGGLSFLFLARRYGSDLFGEGRRRDDPNRPRGDS
jgi:hypothetical protein